MSYDLFLFKPIEGEDPLKTAERILEEEENDVLDLEKEEIDTIDEEKEYLKNHIASKLIEVNPALEKYGDIQLIGPEDGNGIQIIISGDSVSISVPYWHSGEHAKEVFNEITSYIKVIEAEANYLTFDPQLEQIIDVDVDLPEILGVNEHVIDQMSNVIPKPTPDKKQPWWKFW